MIHPMLKNNSNYEDWSDTSKIYFEIKDLWDVVGPECQQPSPHYDFNMFNVWKKKNARALYTIRMSCDQEVLSEIKGINTAKEAWMKLEDKFKQPSTIRMVPAFHDNSSASCEIQVDERDVISINHLFSSGSYTDVIGLCETNFSLLEEIAPTSRCMQVFFELIMLAGIESQFEDHLVNMLNKEGFPKQILLMRNSSGETPLTIAAGVGAKKITETIIAKEPRLLSIPNEFGHIPVTVAVGTDFHDMIGYLYSKMPHHVWSNKEDTCGAAFVTKAIIMGKLDFVLELLKKVPYLSFAKDSEGKSPLSVAASTPSLFQTERGRIHLWQLKASSFLSRLKVLLFIPETDSMTSTRSLDFEYCHSELLDLMKEAIQGESNAPVCDALLEAIKCGNLNFVAMLMSAGIHISIEVADCMSRNVFMCAIEHRRVEIFRLLCRGANDEVKLSAIHSHDKLRNNLLHLAAKLAPTTILNHISGPALQMQKEVQWFKEVEKIVQASASTSRNIDHMTPSQLFTVNHKDLMVAGETWMKNTASSYMNVVPLILTIMFAAIFQVPDGNNQETGYPIFLNKGLFDFYIICVATSVFSSIISLVMFLKLLTSKYTEDEFFRSLPDKMIIGLLFLFLSLATMILAICFGLSLFLEGKLRIIIPVTVVACIPVWFFIKTQFPLLVEICRSTYWPKLELMETKSIEWMKTKKSKTTV